MLRKLFAAAAVVALAHGANVTPAGAHPEVSVFVGTATVEPGLWFPGFGASVNAGWTLPSSGGVGVTVEGSGSVSGFCGRSTGSGTVRIGSHSNIPVTWQSAGGTIVITGSAAGHTGGAVVQARPISVTGSVPCVTVAATSFTVAGTASIA